MNRLVILAIFFVGVEAVAAPLWERLARDRRYSDIVQLSLGKLGANTCRDVECQKPWLRNLGRASVLMGDYDSAKYYLRLSSELDRDDLASQKLLAYSAILIGDYQLYESRRSVIIAKHPEQAVSLKVLRGISGNDRNDAAQIEAVQKIVKETGEDEWKEAGANYSTHERRSPWVAGTMSALIPGSGQAYLGMWQSAATSFLLVAVSALTTAELARDGRYATATAAGLIGSVFYVGGILSAARSAEELNDRHYQGSRERLRNYALPELRFEWQVDLSE